MPIFADISHFNNVADYLPLLNACIIIDMIVIILCKYGYINSRVLEEWYYKFNISATICDILIIFIGIIIARFIYPFIFSKFNIWKFAGLAVFVQIIHDFLFYFMFQQIEYGKNEMIDVFKKYADEVGGLAIISDSLMIFGSCLLGSLFANYSLNINIIILTLAIYLIPYLVYSFYKN